MDKIEYTEYSEVIKGDEGDIEVIVQVPKDPEQPVVITDKSGSRYLRRTLSEWTGINNVIEKALKDAGWVRD